MWLAFATTFWIVCGGHGKPPGMWLYWPWTTFISVRSKALIASLSTPFIGTTHRKLHYHNLKAWHPFHKTHTQPRQYTFILSVIWKYDSTSEAFEKGRDVWCSGFIVSPGRRQAWESFSVLCCGSWPWKLIVFLPQTFWTFPEWWCVIHSVMRIPEFK